MTDEAFRRIDSLIQVGLRLARSAPSGRTLLARIAIAIDPVWLPRPWGDTIAAELEAARGQACEPIEFRRVEQQLKAAWGGRPTDELDELDREPAAVTPTAQVHRGVLDGAPVAVKVLRPGLAASVRQDLSLLEGLLAPLGAAFPAVDAVAVVREFRERVLDELDLETEASTQRRFHRALRDHPFLTVPAPVTRLSHEGVLVSDWIDGVPLWQAPDPDQAAARLVVFVLGAARAGLIHADPDPDDVLVLADGRLAILDFGATRTVEPDRAAAAADAIEAFVAADAEAFGAAVEQLGWLPAGHAPTALELAQHVLAEHGGQEPTRLDSDAIVAGRERLFGRPEQLVELILASALPPQDLWPVRGAAQLYATIARVGATGRWRELTRSAVQDGWDAAGA
jgi:predicted unusual protein kinase regulating ubiquinone biosynthesis (AarF/ABC1/UbiB family)